MSMYLYPLVKYQIDGDSYRRHLEDTTLCGYSAASGVAGIDPATTAPQLDPVAREVQVIGAWARLQGYARRLATVLAVAGRHRVAGN
jgi:hypothetical protein